MQLGSQLLGNSSAGNKNYGWLPTSSPQQQQNQIRDKANIGYLFWNPYDNQTGYTTKGYTPAGAAAQLGRDFRGVDTNADGLMGAFRDYADEIGLDPWGAEANEFADIFGQYRSGSQDVNKTLESSTALNSYQSALEQATKGKQAGGMFYDAIKFAAPASFYALASAAGANALGGLTGLGSIGSTGGMTGVSAGNAPAFSLSRGISSLYDAIPSLGEFGNSIAQGALKGGVSSALTGGDPLQGALTGGAFGGLGTGVDQVIDGVSGLFPDSEFDLAMAQNDYGNAVGNANPLPDALKSTFDSFGDDYNLAMAQNAFGNSIGQANPAPQFQETLRNPDTLRNLQNLTLSPEEMANIEPSAGDSMFNLSSIQDYLGKGAKAAIPSAISSGIGYFGNKQAKDDILRQLEKAEGLLQPYLQSGQLANEELQSLLSSGELTRGFTPSDLKNSEGYQFRLSEGLGALDKSLAARGSLDSGRAIKEATEYAQGLASEEYADEYQRFMQDKLSTYNQLMGLASQGNSNAAQIGNIYGAMGDVSANATASNFSNLGSTLSQFLRGTGAFDDYFGQQDNNDLLNAILGRL